MLLLLLPPDQQLFLKHGQTPALFWAQTELSGWSKVRERGKMLSKVRRRPWKTLGEVRAVLLRGCPSLRTHPGGVFLRNNIAACFIL